MGSLLAAALERAHSFLLEPPVATGRAAGAIAAADTVVCVADGSAEPALCALVGDMLGQRYGVRVLVAANRVRDQDEWSGRCAVALPESRLAAMRIARGRPPGGAVGDAIARLTTLLEEGSGL